MYLDDLKKLFHDLADIPSACGYMENMADAGYTKTIDQMISNIDGLSSGRMDPDMRDLSRTSEFFEFYNDKRRYDKIRRILAEELNSKYVMVCNNCNKTYFYANDPTIDGKRHRCVR
jgi:hypothetical protein